MQLPSAGSYTQRTTGARSAHLVDGETLWHKRGFGVESLAHDELGVGAIGVFWPSSFMYFGVCGSKKDFGDLFVVDPLP
jgi:hypothetical protein